MTSSPTTRPTYVARLPCISQDVHLHPLYPVEVNLEYLSLLSCSLVPEHDYTWCSMRQTNTAGAFSRGYASTTCCLFHFRVSLPRFLECVSESSMIGLQVESWGCFERRKMPGCNQIPVQYIACEITPKTAFGLDSKRENILVNSSMWSVFFVRCGW